MIEEIFLEDDTIIDTEEWDNDSYYIVFSGSIEVRDKNNEILLACKSGDFPGEEINLNFFSSEANIHTISDTELLRINKGQFIDLITSEYDATITILNSFQKEEEISNVI
jgi:CRP-like cAMP-binding protein